MSTALARWTVVALCSLAAAAAAADPAPAVGAEVAKTLDQLRAAADALAEADAMQARALKSTVERIAEWTAEHPSVRRQDFQDLRKVRDRVEGLERMWRGAQQTAKADIFAEQARKIDQACQVLEAMVVDAPALPTAAAAPGATGPSALTVSLRLEAKSEQVPPAARQERGLVIRLLEPDESFQSAALLQRYVNEHADEIRSAAVTLQVAPEVPWRDVLAVANAFWEAPLTGPMSIEGLSLRSLAPPAVPAAPGVMEPAPAETPVPQPAPEPSAAVTLPAARKEPSAPPAVVPSLELSITPTGPME